MDWYEFSWDRLTLTKHHHYRYYSIGLYPPDDPGDLERRLVRQFHTMLNHDQRPSPPNPDITDVEDFKYFLTASVRPRT